MPSVNVRSEAVGCEQAAKRTEIAQRTPRKDALSFEVRSEASPSPSGRGWREAPGEGGNAENLSFCLPSSGPSGHLLPEGEGLDCNSAAILDRPTGCTMRVLIRWALSECQGAFSDPAP